MDILSGNSILIYFFIFFGKIIEVTATTVRIVLINRGERKKGTLIALLEIALWIVIAGTVLNGLNEDIFKAVLYCVAFALGVFVGSWLEGKIALGISTIQAIVDYEGFEELLKRVREQKMAVTVLDGSGMEGPKKILLIHLKRKRIAEAVKLINSVNDNCVITVSDIKVLHGGFIKK